MVFNSSQLRNSGRPIRVSSEKVIRYLTYATNDAKADVLAPGYFNNARLDLSVGTIIEAEVACSGAQERVRMRVATMPVGGNITTALAQGGGVGVLTNFSTAKAKIQSGGGDVTFLVDGDSTGNGTDEWVYLFAVYLASLYPTHTVEYRLWDTTAYGAVTTIQTGTGSRKIAFYNASIPGEDPRRLLGTDFAAAIGNVPYPDVVIWNHGHNVISSPDASTRGTFLMGFEAAKLKFPNAQTVIVAQNPRRDDTGSDTQIAASKTLAAQYGDTVLDFNAVWVAAGKPAGWYADNIHPNGTGSAQNLNVAKAAWDGSRAATAELHPAWLAGVTLNLLDIDGSSVDQGYGYFKNYVSGTPSGWSLNGTPTLARDTTIVDTEMGDTFSLKLTSSASGAGMRRDVSAPALVAAKAAGFATLAVRKYVPTGQTVNAGRVGVNQTGTGAASITSQANNNMIGRWVWEILANIPIPSGLTFLTPTIYVDTSAAGEINIGRVVLVGGSVPRDDQTAP